jgi:hypothetical protein
MRVAAAEMAAEGCISDALSLTLTEPDAIPEAAVTALDAFLALTAETDTDDVALTAADAGRTRSHAADTLAAMSICSAPSLTRVASTDNAAETATAALASNTVPSSPYDRAP